ncbi:hypothetical protein GUITHDRAFT_122828 [Guillardia theta CCMP2712]|uniref:Uncharacterized protein n=1 Tax=Guillardia theta (strain CCMP2712) TaxID=905079 RepID=L1I4Z4_GUITC|nr:hypothetical protein GUITHDRAFT_122828 [Guillardia theta CCMP2712]EKX30964.1 hypothetical protein GUITHDRAFT_122828 [Guillardia theta CCMP2712]|eukprot:XP_005817944.1 hypothetical protein GUITHDRAFT_122828 [Guillardia theta CCMP2712]
MARPHQRLEHEAMLDEPELRELFVEQAAKCNPASDDLEVKKLSLETALKALLQLREIRAACLRGFALKAETNTARDGGDAATMPKRGGSRRARTSSKHPSDVELSGGTRRHSGAPPASAACLRAKTAAGPSSGTKCRPNAASSRGIER